MNRRRRPPVAAAAPTRAPLPAIPDVGRVHERVPIPAATYLPEPEPEPGGSGLFGRVWRGFWLTVLWSALAGNAWLLTTRGEGVAKLAGVALVVVPVTVVALWRLVQAPAPFVPPQVESKYVPPHRKAPIS